MAGAFALEPQLLARAAVERREAGFHGHAEGLFIHVADHEDTAARVVLNDRGDQSIRFGKVQNHCVNNKKPAGVSAAGVLSSFDYGLLGQDPSRVGMVMMMAPGDWVECHKDVW